MTKRNFTDLCLSEISLKTLVQVTIVPNQFSITYAKTRVILHKCVVTAILGLSKNRFSLRTCVNPLQLMYGVEKAYIFVNSRRTLFSNTIVGDNLIFATTLAAAAEPQGVSSPPRLLLTSRTSSPAHIHISVLWVLRVALLFPPLPQSYPYPNL